MTCIAAMVRDGQVWLGADSAAVSGWTLQLRNGQSKLLRIGDMLIGCTTSYRMVDLLRYRVAAPPDDIPDLHRYLATDWIDEVRDVFGKGGFRKRENEREEGGTFLVGWRGRLFHVDDDFQVGEPAAGYSAVGSGIEVALGALCMASRLDLEPEMVIRAALEAAESHNIGVRGPFEVQQAPLFPDDAADIREGGAAMPVRLQRRRTKGYRLPPDAIYVGRRSRWGNRYVVGQRPHPDHIGGGVFPCDCPVVTPESAVALYRADRSLIRMDLAPLRGHDLACWCPLDQPCHADVLLELANR